MALENVCAVKCFIITFALEVCVRGARENAVVSEAGCMDSDQISFSYYVHSYYLVLYPVVADFEAIIKHPSRMIITTVSRECYLVQKAS